jgi:hypothetical protein
MGSREAETEQELAAAQARCAEALQLLEAKDAALQRLQLQLQLQQRTALPVHVALEPGDPLWLPLAASMAPTTADTTDRWVRQQALGSAVAEPGYRDLALRLAESVALGSREAIARPDGHATVGPRRSSLRCVLRRPPGMRSWTCALGCATRTRGSGL